MSKVARQSNGSVTTTSNGPGQDDEICPVCKSSRYLNPTMRLLVNPECYHKMCESCVDRIFSQGPAPCPVAGCGRTLRKQRFRRATFEDLQIEREVDIRRRIAEVFNRREEEFLDLRSWNDYLENVEVLTFNLLNGIDVPQTEAKLAAYRDKNRESIEQNRAVERAEHNTAESRFAAEKKEARLRREESLKEDEEERRHRTEENRKAQERIALTGRTDGKSSKKGNEVVLKKTNAATARAKSSAATTSSTTDSTNTPDDLFEITGLKPVLHPKPETKYDPLGGWTIKHTYYDLQDEYAYEWLDKARRDPAIVVGGYDVRDYCARAMMDAFAGLGAETESGKRLGEESKATQTTLKA